jgi:uncharacterized C2H2 Zn-finger protein
MAENVENNINMDLYCECCKYNAYAPSDLLRHLKTKKHQRHGLKINEIDHQCSQCEYVTKNQYHYNIHVIRVHGSSKEKQEKCPYYCSICDTGFFAQLSYEKHIKSKTHKNLAEINKLRKK